MHAVYRSFFNDQYYTFGVEWTDKQICPFLPRARNSPSPSDFSCLPFPSSSPTVIWINSRVRKALNLNFKSKTFFQRGKFPASYGNGTIIVNPWANAGNPLIAPFDQQFYLRFVLLCFARLRRRRDTHLTSAFCWVW